MILVVEIPEDSDKANDWKVRIVLWDDEPEPRLADVRLALRGADDRLPTRLSLIPIKRVDKNRRR